VSSQFLKRLAGALGVLVVLWLGLSFFRQARRDTSGSFELPKVDRNAVDAVVFARPTDTVTLAKAGAGWTVNGLPAGSTLVAQVFDAMVDTTARSELVAESASSHQRLGIDSAKARRISFRQGGKEVAALLVGSRGGSFESAYLRAPGENAVYQVKGRLIEYVDRTVDDWRDKRIVALEPDGVAGVEVQLGKKSYSLARAEKTWTVNGAAADSSAVASLLNQFKTLDAAGFATPAQADSANFAAPDRVIRLKGPADRTLALLRIDSTASGYWVRRDDNPTVFRIDSWIVNQLTPTDSTLRKK
jgi:hypothetical protein